MRKLKLQVQMSVDGFVAGPNGELDWMTWDWDDELKKNVTELTNSFDTILLGRKMTDGFVSYWTDYVKNNRIPRNTLLQNKWLIILRLYLQKLLIKVAGKIQLWQKTI